MNTGIQERLNRARERFEEVERLLSDPDVISDRKQFQALSREYGELEPIIQVLRESEANQQAANDAREMADEGDREIAAMANDELRKTRDRAARLEQRLQTLLLPRDPNDSRNIFLEVRAGT